MLRNNASYKYESSIKVPYNIIQRWKNGTVTLRIGATTASTNIQRVKPYKGEDMKQLIIHNK